MHLFRDGRGIATVLIWVVNFMNLLVLYSLSNWLPTVVTGMGYTTQTAVLVGTVLQVGGTIGTFGLAWLIARGGFIPMLTATFAVATASIALIGQPGISLALLNVIVFVAGWAIIGGQPGINALSATFYPTYLRSTGVGWGLGIGRTGAIVGPLPRGDAARAELGSARTVPRRGRPGAGLDADDHRAVVHHEAARSRDGTAVSADRALIDRLTQVGAISDACRCELRRLSVRPILSVRSADRLSVRS